jgi:REP element-mobilizing transposase RayT
VSPFWRMDRYWFFSNTFYGNWLPGAEPGFVSRVRDRRPDEAPSAVRHEHNQPGTPCDRAMPGLHRHAQSLLKCDPIRIAVPHAEALLVQFRETAGHRGWELRAVAIMANHVHLVVGVRGDPSPTKVLGDLKAYGSRKLNLGWRRPPSGTWWTYDGSKRKVKDEAHLRAVIEYVRNQADPLIIWIADDEVVASPVA